MTNEERPVFKTDPARVLAMAALGDDFDYDSVSEEDLDQLVELVRKEIAGLASMEDVREQVRRIKEGK